MNEHCKKRLIATKSTAHIREFEKCVGVVLGQTDWGRGVVGPEVDVRWQPSGLKYTYDPSDLNIEES